jgi:hypothetical protein
MRRKPNMLGFTIVEAAVASLLAFVMGLTIILTIVQSMHHKQFESERAVALNRATHEMELLKRKLFTDLKSTPYNYGSTVTHWVHLNNPIILNPATGDGLDIHNTPADPNDDLPAELYVRLSTLNNDWFIPDTYFTGWYYGFKVREVGDAVQVKVTVKWTSMGKDHMQTVSTIIAP